MAVASAGPYASLHLLVRFSEPVLSLLPFDGVFCHVFVAVTHYLDDCIVFYSNFKEFLCLNGCLSHLTRDCLGATAARQTAAMFTRAAQETVVVWTLYPAHSYNIALVSDVIRRRPAAASFSFGLHFSVASCFTRLSECLVVER